MNMNTVRTENEPSSLQNVFTEKQVLLPENAPLEIELADAELENIYGGDGGLLGGLPLLGGVAKGLPLLGGGA